MAFLTSSTSPTALTITVPGEKTFFPSGYFCTIESESFPVGTLIPNSITNSLNALTARYKRASSPLFFAGHIQFALKETDFRLSFKGAHIIFVSASATALTEALRGSIKPTTGA